MTTDMPAPDEPSPGLVLYTSPDGSARLQLRIEHKTLWLTQRQLADLFQKSPPTINEHIQNIFSEGELPPEATIRKFRIVQAEGSRTVERLVDHYSLDVVIAVGYRVRSARGTQFRQWATAKDRTASNTCSCVWRAASGRWGDCAGPAGCLATAQHFLKPARYEQRFNAGAGLHLSGPTAGWLRRSQQADVDHLQLVGRRLNRVAVIIHLDERAQSAAGPRMGVSGGREHFLSNCSRPRASAYAVPVHHGRASTIRPFLGHDQRDERVEPAAWA